MNSRIAVIGGSDAGIEAARRCLELDPSVEVSLLVADAFPNWSICGIPYYVSGEVGHWRNLAHRTAEDLEGLGIRLLLEHRVTSLDLGARSLRYVSPATADGVLEFDSLVLGTGAQPARPPIEGLDDLGSAEGVHVLHTMPDTFALNDTVTAVLSATTDAAPTAVVVGAGYVGMEMAEALTTRGLRVVVAEQLPQILPRTLDPELATVVEEHLRKQGVEVHCGVTVESVAGSDDGVERSRVRVRIDDERVEADLVLVAAGVRPATGLAVQAGLDLGASGAVWVDRQMRTSADGVWAAGDCVHTHHRLLRSETYLPLGTAAHKQGRIAGENVLGGEAEYAGSLGTQSVKLFDLVAAATGLRDDEARQAGFTPLTTQVLADDHKRYYPGATPMHVRVTGDRVSGRLLGAQLVGSYGAEVSKRIDVFATAIHNANTVAQLSDLDLSYTPPLSSPWDPVQQAAQAWLRER